MASNKYKPIHTNLSINGKIKVSVPVSELTDADDLITRGVDADNLSNVQGSTISEALNTLNKQLNPPSVGGLTFIGRSTYVRVESVLEDLNFRWDEFNNPAGLILSDSLGIMGDVPVSGGVYNGDDKYQFFTSQYITWNLVGDDGVNSSTNTRWVYPSYFGVNTTGIMPERPIIDDEPEILTYTASEFAVTPNNASNEYVWFAVPVTDGSVYTKWYISQDNNGLIGDDQFISRGDNVDMNNTTYERYITNYPSDIVGEIKLS